MAPKGGRELVIGHEMLGKVTETGSAVTRVKPGISRCSPCGAAVMNACPA